MEKQVKQSNLCAQLGFLLTLFNLVVSSAFIITGSKYLLLIFATVTAVLSLILSSIGKINSRRLERGNILSLIGIIANVLIISTLAVFCGVTTF